jgi:glycerol uptake facilitator-like aquaporin
MAKKPKMKWEMMGDFIGTFVFILAGIGVVASAVFANAQVWLFSKKQKEKKKKVKISRC